MRRTRPGRNDRKGSVRNLEQTNHGRSAKAVPMARPLVQLEPHKKPPIRLSNEGSFMRIAERMKAQVAWHECNTRATKPVKEAGRPAKKVTLLYGGTPSIMEAR